MNNSSQDQSQTSEVSGEGWQPIETAPDMDRIWVAGWQNRHGRCAGYWWQEEDMVINGKPQGNPAAIVWRPIPEAPSWVPKDGIK